MGQSPPAELLCRSTDSTATQAATSCLLGTWTVPADLNPQPTPSRRPQKAHRHKPRRIAPKAILCHPPHREPGPRLHSATAERRKQPAPNWTDLRSHTSSGRHRAPATPQQHSLAQPATQHRTRPPGPTPQLPAQSGRKKRRPWAKILRPHQNRPRTLPLPTRLPKPLQRRAAHRILRSCPPHCRCRRFRRFPCRQPSSKRLPLLRRMTAGRRRLPTQLPWRLQPARMLRPPRTNSRQTSRRSRPRPSRPVLPPASRLPPTRSRPTKLRPPRRMCAHTMKHPVSLLSMKRRRIILPRQQPRPRKQTVSRSFSCHPG